MIPLPETALQTSYHQFSFYPGHAFVVILRITAMRLRSGKPSNDIIFTSASEDRVGCLEIIRGFYDESSGCNNALQDH